MRFGDRTGIRLIILFALSEKLAIQLKVLLWRFCESALLIVAGGAMGARSFGHAGVWTIAPAVVCLVGWVVMLRFEPWSILWRTSDNEGWVVD